MKLKGTSYPEMKIWLSSIRPVLKESRYKCLSSQNVFGPSQENSFAAFSENNLSRLGLLFKHKYTAENKIKWLNTARPLESKSLENQRSQTDLKKCYLQT